VSTSSEADAPSPVAEDRLENSDSVIGNGLLRSLELKELAAKRGEPQLRRLPERSHQTLKSNCEVKQLVALMAEALVLDALKRLKVSCGPSRLRRGPLNPNGAVGCCARRSLEEEERCREEIETGNLLKSALRVGNPAR
jgi:hypothetical protein